MKLTVDIIIGITTSVLSIIGFFLHFYAFSKKAGGLDQKLDDTSKKLDDKVSKEVFEAKIGGIEHRVSTVERIVFKERG